MKSKMIFIALIVSAMIGASSTLWACFVRSPQPVQVWLDHIEVEITDQVATKTYDCTFLNPNANAVVGGVCYMELEPGARVDKMSVVVNGKGAKAEILDVKQANKVFAEIVKEGGSPALLEYYGNQLIQTKVPKIPPNGTVKVKLRYTTVLQKRGDVVRLQMLNTNPKADMKALKSASVRVAIRSQTPIKNIYSPTHPIQIGEAADWDVVIHWSQQNYLPKHPFVLYYQLDQRQVGATLIAHREPGQEGHFLLMLSPTMGRGVGSVSHQDILPKDVVFCVDASGSMLQGKKMEQAQEALRYCIQHLRPGDRFNIVDFGTGVRQFTHEQLVAASEENRQAALRYIDKLAARGGTAMDEALATSLDMLRGGNRLKMILFATDGLPTIGERSPQAILGRVAKRNSEDVRLFVFGQGNDVNTRLLDLLALNHRGQAEYVLPEEDASDLIGKFFDRVGSPIMADLRVEFDGINTHDVFPRAIPDIYKDEQVILYGRYDGGGPQIVRLTGYVDGQQRSFEYELDFAEISIDERNAYVPRLWAGQMVDDLMNEIRRSGRESPELVQHVTYLAKRYGIVTPYTSFLMVEETCNLPLAWQAGEFNKRLRYDGNLLGKADGALAVGNAKQQAAGRRQLASNGAASGLYEQVEYALRQEKRSGSALAALRYVGNRCFYNQSGVWYDSGYDTTKSALVKNLEVGSPQYLRMLESDPSLAKYMAQGDVVLQSKGQWYRFQTKSRS